ncbi:hypothetical protein D9615_008545 [Tricholomella constricta]|uniref:Uncharacterized protein n=1 Tax=Tricholomella constricta TaxID=117010 RepID=A0A8H5H3W7_9AGAR|nr:hypothetical protein D9615_008545 [Tricholomella constricta]
MRFRISQSLVRSLHSVSRFLYDMVLPPLPEQTLVGEILFPHKRLNVSQWYSELHIDGKDFGELLTGSFVRKLYFVKAAGRSQHESIVAEIHNRTVADFTVRYLRLERSSGDLKLEHIGRREQKWHKFGLPGTQVRSMSDASSDSSPIGKYDAVDTVREIRDWVPKDLVYTMTFTDDDHVLSLEDLAIAARVAHKEDTQYSLLQHQCYWWADTLMAILESLVDESHRSKEVFSKERSDDEWAEKVQLGGSEPTPEGSEPTPEGSEPTPEGSEPTPEGSETTPEGSESTSNGKYYITRWAPITVHNRTKVTHLKSRFEACKARYVKARIEKAADLDRIVRAEEGQRRAEAEVKNLQAQMAKLLEERGNPSQSGLQLTPAA